MTGKEEAPGEDGRLDRAIRLFEFLARVQQIKSQTPRTMEAYERDGEVIWLHALPNHPAISTMHRIGGADPLDPILTVDRVPRLAPPSPPEAVANWLTERIDDPASEPMLVEQRVIDGQDADESSIDVEVQSLEECPEVADEYDRWLPSWRAWATSELASIPVREVYGRLFSVHIASTSHPEELEVVCGVACLGWQPDQHDRAQRHAFTAGAAVEFDDDSGRLTVRAVEATETLSLELDMLDPAVVRDPQRISEIRDAARSLNAHALDRDEASLLGRRLVHCLDPDGQYVDDERAPAVGPEPVIHYAPAVILRRRSQQSLLHVFEAIVSQMREAGQVPDGLLPLIDPNHQPDPGLTWEGAEGAIVPVDDEVFLPLPVNAAQLRVVRRVDASAQTLVQGPPGTGKTHTAAALISHLLAQGKRVLVTAQTDRALKEVRTKLPEAIKPLSVAVVGAGREDMADLKIAVERIAAAAMEHEDEVARGRIDRHLAEIDVLRRQRASVHHRLIEAREAEVRTYERPEVSGTLAAIAQAYERNEATFSWIHDLVEVAPDAEPPLTDSEIAEWRRLLLDEVLLADEGDAMKDLLDPTPLPSPVDFGDLVRAEQDAYRADLSFEDVHGHDAFGAFMQLPAETRDTLRTELHGLANEADALARRREAWMARALSDDADGFCKRMPAVAALRAAGVALDDRHLALADLSAALRDGAFPKWLTLRRSRSLLVHASRLLSEITAGRYAFADLDSEDSQWFVFDSDNGQPRSPSSLSGGEKFVASLALALGMVEMMGRQGDRIESLFLDEGFGALDRTNLDAAVEALGAVAATGRLVVVITHLRAVAEQIDHVLSVTREPTGTQAVWLSDSARSVLAEGDLSVSSGLLE